MHKLQLHGFFNSSASYRVRIALSLKGLAFEKIGVDIRKGMQNSSDYKMLSPIGLVPTLKDNGEAFIQSLAIIDHLEQIQPEPRLVPETSAERRRVLEIAQLIACEIHPLNNLRVLKYLSGTLALSEAQKQDWIAHWITLGFDALEVMLPEQGCWCVGSNPTLADCCLVPQVANALRCKIDLAPWTHIKRVYEHCIQHPAFIAAHPSKQPDFSVT